MSLDYQELKYLDYLSFCLFVQHVFHQSAVRCLSIASTCFLKTCKINKKLDIFLIYLSSLSLLYLSPIRFFLIFNSMSTKRQTKVRAVETVENADSTGRQRQLKRDEVSFF
jgi:hypothetical protein